MSEANPMRVAEMYAAIAKLKVQKIETGNAVARALPPGTEVTWETTRNGERYLQRGEVTRVDSIPGAIRVRNTRTGKTTRIYVSSAYGFSAAGMWA